jgi:hypothetical protein
MAAGWTSTHPSRAAFLAGPLHDRHNSGIQIDWDNVAAGYVDAVTGKKVLPAGTAVGLLLGTGKASPRVDTTNPAVGLLETSAREDDTVAPGGGMYGMVVGGPVWENFLPDAVAGVLPSDIKDELQAAGTGFYYQTFTDTP